MDHLSNGDIGGNSKDKAAEERHRVEIQQLEEKLAEQKGRADELEGRYNALLNWRTAPKGKDPTKKGSKERRKKAKDKQRYLDGVAKKAAIKHATEALLANTIPTDIPSVRLSEASKVAILSDSPFVHHRPKGDVFPEEVRLLVSYLLSKKVANNSVFARILGVNEGAVRYWLGAAVSAEAKEERKEAAAKAKAEREKAKEEKAKAKEEKAKAKEEKAKAKERGARKTKAPKAKKTAQKGQL